MKSFLSFLFLLIFIQTSNSQNFVNSDLNGPPPPLGVSVLPYSWQSVPFSDINCHADYGGYDTPDLCAPSGSPFNATPYSGSTFVSGLLQRSGTWIWHEGIKQTVSGFCVGCTYTINFYQSMMRINSLTDNSGSWSVYIDNTLTGTSEPTICNVLPPVLNWEYRRINFVATSTTHTIKFLPTDDDTSWNVLANPKQCIRMTIDSIYITYNIILPIELLSFSANQKDDDIVFTWTTSSETNNDFFTIEKSINTLEWNDVVKKPGSGNSSTNISYEAFDLDPHHGISYYRLKQTDYDGQFSYSNIVMVDFRNFEDVRVYPIPALDHFIVECNQLFNPRFTLSNLVNEIPIYYTNSSSGYIIETSHIPGGVYFLTIEQNGIIMKRERIIVQ